MVFFYFLFKNKSIISVWGCKIGMKFGFLSGAAGNVAKNNSTALITRQNPISFSSN
jgi:hypothetical protein